MTVQTPLGTLSLRDYFVKMGWLLEVLFVNG